MRAAFGLEFMADLARQTGKSLDQLEPRLKNALDRAGIDAKAWEKLRAGAIREHNGSRFLDPLETMRSADRHTAEAATKLHSLILQEMDMAVPQADAGVRAFMNAGARPNTLIGEIWRSGLMYRSYPVTVLMTHSLRAASGLSETWRGSTRFFYGPALFASMSVLGMASLQSKQIFAGRDPLEWDSPKVWAKAVAQGGGLGIFGDFFTSALSRTDQELAGTLFGPGFAFISDVLRLTTRNVIAEAEGKNSHSADDAIMFLQRYTPGSNLWYTKLAVDRLFWSQLRLMADPEAARSMARVERKALIERNQGHWWRPGQTTPTRAPEFGGR